MNAYSKTAHMLAGALLQRPRADQTVHICRKSYTGSSERIVVLVKPAGEAGDYYEVGRHALAALQDGMTPAELELEAIEDPSEDDERIAHEAHEARSIARHERSMSRRTL